MILRHLILLSSLIGSTALATELPDAFVEKVLGATGVHHEPGKYVKADLVYKNEAGQTLFSLRLAEPKIYEAWKSAAPDKIEAVSGVGDDAFTYKRLGGLCARTATSAACISALPLPGSIKLSPAQLATLIRAAL
jgi:hypothetical protein